MAPAGEVEVFAEPGGTVAGPQAGSANEGEPGEQSGLTHFAEDVVMQQLLFHDRPQRGKIGTRSQSLVDNLVK